MSKPDRKTAEEIIEYHFITNYLFSNKKGRMADVKRELCEALLELGIPLLQNKSGEKVGSAVPASAIKEFFGQEEKE